MSETVRYCQICRAKTWHVDDVCEWADGHATMEQARRQAQTPPPPTKDTTQAR